jgi:hypothetical protein
MTMKYLLIVTTVAFLFCLAGQANDEAYECDYSECQEDCVYFHGLECLPEVEEGSEK